MATGEAPYVADLKFEGMVHGALKFSDHPRAKVLKINTSVAEKLDGVLRVFTAEDIPGERHTGLIVPDWPLMLQVVETTRSGGDLLAGVVAETALLSRRAVALIADGFNVLAPV